MLFKDRGFEGGLGGETHEIDILTLTSIKDCFSGIRAYDVFLGVALRQRLRLGVCTREGVEHIYRRKGRFTPVPSSIPGLTFKRPLLLH